MARARSMYSSVIGGICAVAVALLVGAPVAARADVAPPNGCGSSAGMALCAGLKAGDACTFANGTKGSCAALFCTNDAGQTLLECVATGASPPSGGCSALPVGAATASGGLAGGGLLVAMLVATRRRRRRSSAGG